MNLYRTVFLIIAILLTGCSKDSDSEDQQKKFTIGISVMPTGAGRVSGLTGDFSGFIQTYTEGSVF
ncbi:MAG: hypothetical protein GY931_00050, partial [Maribacter sp.]|nr:hypothetical protein [Maribacter sp.]